MQTDGRSTFFTIENEVVMNVIPVGGARRVGTTDIWVTNAVSVPTDENSARQAVESVHNGRIQNGTICIEIAYRCIGDRMPNELRNAGNAANPIGVKGQVEWLSTPVNNPNVYLLGIAQAQIMRCSKDWTPNMNVTGISVPGSLRRYNNGEISVEVLSGKGEQDRILAKLPQSELHTQEWWKFAQTLQLEGEMHLYSSSNGDPRLGLAECRVVKRDFRCCASVER